MTTELYFIYDSHCPWSYAATPLVNALQTAFPKMTVHLLHNAHYTGSDGAGEEQIKAIVDISDVNFGKEYMRHINSPKNSIKAANFMGWVQSKQAKKQLTVLNALQQAHFIEGNPLTHKSDFNTITEQLKLSPPNKIFRDEPSHDTECVLAAIDEIQQLIGTTAFPALIMTVNDNAIFIDHSLYLNEPHSVVPAVKKEIAAF